MKKSLADQLSKLTGKPTPEECKKKKQEKRQFANVSEKHLLKGRIIFVPLSEDEGLIVTDGYDKRNKFVTIIGIAPDGAIIGSLLINTNPNETTPELRDCQYLLKGTNYPAILDYDSWLDCSQIFRIPKHKIVSRGKYCGKITEPDWEYIEQFLVDTDVLSNAEKREFGII